MPAAAIRWTERPTSSSPPSRTEPVTRPPDSASTRPRMAWQSVDLPMPLRPITATGSSPTAKDAPCTMCALPYQASRFSTARSGSDMLRPQVQRLHELGGADLVRGALHHDGAVVHHRHEVGHAQRDVHVVLDQHDGDVALQPEEELRQQLALARRQPGGRLVEHDEPRVARERDGE